MEIIKTNNIWNKEKINIVGSCINSFDIYANEGDEIPSDYIWFEILIDKKIVGYIWINVLNNETEVSICIEKQHRGKGYVKVALAKIEKIIVDSKYPLTIIATVKAINEYAVNMNKILYEAGYRCTYIPGINDCNAPIGFIKKGMNVSYIKEL